MSAAAAHGHHVDDRPIRPDEHFADASPGKLGMWIFLLSDALMFAGFLLAYGILRAGTAGEWISSSEPILGIPFTAGLTFLLICSSLTMVFSYAALVEGDRKKATMFLFLTALGGGLFLLGQMEEYFGVLGIFSHGLTNEGLTWGQSHYATTFYVTTSFHGAHVLTGTILLLVTAFRTAAGKSDVNELEVVGLFWHFVDLIWILVFTLIYLL